MKRKYVYAICLIGCVICSLLFLLFSKDENTYRILERDIYNDAILDENTGLIGYDNLKVYVSTMTEDGVVYSYIEEGILKEIYTSKADIILFDSIYKGAIVICEYDFSERFTIKRIDIENEKELITKNCYGYPDIKIIGNQLLLGYAIKKDNIVMQYLISYNFEGKEFDIIDKYEYKINEDGNITGELLQTFDGHGTELAIEIISFCNENMFDDKTGIAELKIFDIENRKFSNLPIYPERKLTYVWSDKKIVITSDYAYEKPLSNTGTIYFMEDTRYDKVKLEGIETANDIKATYRINDHILLIQTLSDIYILNEKNRKYERKTDIYGIQVYKNSFGYINERNKLEIYEFTQ